MGLFKKLRSHLKTSLSGGLNLLSKKERSEHRKSNRALRKSLGMTSRNKWVRQLRRSLSGKAAAQPTSAATVGGYTYNGRTLSQLMGGR